jgi:hypothetical protein
MPGTAFAMGMNDAVFALPTNEDIEEPVMNHDARRDQVSESDSPAGAGKDETRAANPTEPQSEDESKIEKIEKVETDALIEDRFEATDN